MKIAFVFPGQGSQHVGMGKNLYENFDEVKTLYKEASDALGYDVADLSFNGPAEELNKTHRTQPCLLAASMAAYTVLKAKGIKPICCCRPQPRRIFSACCLIGFFIQGCGKTHGETRAAYAAGGS